MKEHVITDWVTNIFGSEDAGECLVNLNLALAGTYILLLVLIYFIFYSGKSGGFRNFIKSWLLKLTILGGVAIYLIGYHVKEPDVNLGVTFLLALFSTARLFILGNDLIEVHEKVNAVFLIWFSVFSVSAALISTSVLINFIGRSFKSRLRIFFNFSSKNYVFFGLNDASLTLAKDIKEKHKSSFIVFIQDIISAGDVVMEQKVWEMGAVVVNPNTVSNYFTLQHEEFVFQPNVGHGQHVSGGIDLILKRLGGLSRKIKNRPTEFFILSENETANFRQAKFLLGDIKKLKINKDFKVHVSVFSRISENQGTKVLVKDVDIKELVIHHYATLVSRSLINKFHPVDFVEIDKSQATAKTEFSALIIGFGQIGTHVLRKLIEQGQFVGHKFRATVIDRNMDALQGRFEHLYPEVVNNYSVDFVNAEAGHSKFYNTVKDKIKQTNYVVVALGNDELNLQTTLELLEINEIKAKPNLKIFVKLENESHWENMFEKPGDKVVIFGKSNDVFNAENMLQMDAEKRATVVHEVYRLLYKDTRTFDEITRHEQLSNISVAEHLYAKVRLLGYEHCNNVAETLSRFSEKYTDNENYKNSLTDIQRLNLAVGEHLRWNAFHFIHGWTFLPFDQLLGNKPGEKHGKRKNPELKKHSCLTSWEKLKELETILKTDMQEAGLPEAEMVKANMQKADIDSVDHLYDFINFIPPVNHAE
jgi:uncharacterized protein (UPF0305 family)